MLKSTLASLALATSLVTGCADKAPQVIAVPAPAAQVQPGSMMVTGTATLEVSPDCADITMTLTSDGAKPGIATAAVQAKQEKLVEALKALGVETTDMKLSYLSLNPIYDPNPEGWSQLRVRTYRAEITEITVTTKKFERIAGIMESGAESGVSSMSTQFRRSDMPELKKKVREMALAAAKDKAKQTADTLGIQLGRVVSVAENHGGYMWSAAYFPANAVAFRNDSSAVALGGAMQPLTLDVTIGFELAKG